MNPYAHQPKTDPHNRWYLLRDPHAPTLTAQRDLDDGRYLELHTKYQDYEPNLTIILVDPSERGTNRANSSDSATGVTAVEAVMPKDEWPKWVDRSESAGANVDPLLAWVSAEAEYDAGVDCIYPGCGAESFTDHNFEARLSGRARQMLRLCPAHGGPDEYGELA